MELRKIEINDLEDFCLFLNKFSFRRIKSIETSTLINKFKELLESKSEFSTYIAKEESEIVGFISVHWLPYFIFGGIEGYISELFVSEEFRGRSIGTKLFNQVEKEAEDKNCIRLNLLNSSERTSYKRGFYDKLGFYERTEFKNFVKTDFT